ncbi:hypothetical protein BC827DRAFT_333397 [Russula dissimulans]|nr:hypothetical protein BC827DRAFT_333397 [Russula dissimulans]
MSCWEKSWADLYASRAQAGWLISLMGALRLVSLSLIIRIFPVACVSAIVDDIVLKHEARGQPAPPPHNSLSHPLNPLLALPRHLQTVASHKRHSDPSVDSLLGVPFLLVQHAWRFERLAFHSPSQSGYVSRPRTAHLSGHHPIANERLFDACTKPTPSSIVVDTEVLGLLVDVHLRESVLLHSPGLAVHLRL